MWWITPDIKISMGIVDHKSFAMLNRRFSAHQAQRQQRGFPEGHLVQAQRFDLQPWYDLLIDDQSRRVVDASERAQHIYYLL